MALIISGRLFHRLNGQVIYRNGEGNLGSTPGNGGGGNIDLGNDGYGSDVPYQNTGTTGTNMPRTTPFTAGPTGNTVGG